VNNETKRNETKQNKTMNIVETAEKECTVLGALFQGIVNEMKNSSSLWEDLVSKANKMHVQLKSTVLTFGLFLDAFQRIADLATNTKGSTREIGTAFTRLILRHKAIEQKFKSISNALLDTFVQPLNERIEDWKKSVHNLDKEHAKSLKDYKKLRNDLRKKAAETVKLQKKCRKLPKHDILHNKLNTAIQEVSTYYAMLEEREKQAVRSAMIEERSHFCTLFNLFKPFLELEISLAAEMSHIEDLVQCLNKQTTDPHCLPAASEQVIKDLKGIDYSTIVAFKTPPSSPGSLSSRKSSVCSINSISSSSSNSTGNSRSPTHQQTPKAMPPQLPIPIQHQFYQHGNSNNRSISMPSNVAVSRISSVSSQDSGFTSQEQFFARAPSLLEESEREADGSTSPLLVVSSTLNAWVKRPEIATNSKHPATVTGAPEPAKGSRPAITAHTFDPPSPSLFEKPNWPVYEEGNMMTMDDSTLSRQHSVPSRRCRMRDLSLERHSSMTEQQTYQSTYVNGGRAKPTPPPSIPPDYYGTLTNRSNQDDSTTRFRNGQNPSEIPTNDPRSIIWRQRQPTNYARPSFESADETLDEMYDYLTKSMKPPTAETLRRGMSVALPQHERPAPPVRRTPSIATHSNGQVKRPMATEIPMKTIHDNDFPPPPPDFLLSNDPNPLPPPPPAILNSSGDTHSSLLEEIQRGGFKLRKTVTDRDRSAPRIR